MASSSSVSSTMTSSSMDSSSSPSSSLAPPTTPTVSSHYSFPNITHLVTVKLTDGNYLLWLHQMRAFLLDQHYMRYIDGSYPCPQTEPDKSAWIRADNTLMSLLSATLSESSLAMIIGCQTSAEIWSIIKEYHSQQSTANCSYYKTKLTNLKRGSRTISEYLQEAKSLSDALAAIGEPIPNKDLIQIVLRELGREYDLLVTHVRFYNMN